MSGLTLFVYKTTVYSLLKNQNAFQISTLTIQDEG